MPIRVILLIAAIVTAALVARADETLYRYEADVSPCDPSTGWICGNPCDPPCSDSVEDGHYVLRFERGGESTGYGYLIASAADPPPPTLWVEWRFRSNHPIGPNFYNCDGQMSIVYRRAHETVNMYGDAAISFSGDYAIFGLAIDELHTYRFESPDGNDYRVSVDGVVFIDVRFDNDHPSAHSLHLRGLGSCDGFQNTVNEWDFVRYGTISDGEHIIASDPPAGTVDSAQYGNLDRFAVTFDAANYVYVDEVSVAVTGGIAPTVIQTRRRENDEPDTVEIVLDRPIPANETTTFTFNDGTAINTVEYTLIRPDTDGDGLFDDEDNCPIHPNPAQADCDTDGVGDVCTLADCLGEPACSDCDGNAVPDACDPDCQPNGSPDTCDLLVGTSLDCQLNMVPDECDIASGTSPDCNANDTPDVCDIADGISLDCQPNLVPDECDLASGASPDCNANNTPDECDIADGISLDCQPNTIPDSCELATGTSLDCNANNTPDVCDIADRLSHDCQPNSIPDECDLASGTSADCNTNNRPDECDTAQGASADCDANTVPDACQTDTDGDGLIDPCDGCPDDPHKTAPRICGCGVSDVDSDSDGVVDCQDDCPTDPQKTSPGICGCNAADVDSDLDTVLDCEDRCPGQDDRPDINRNGNPDCLEPDIIPTASSWGLAILAAALLAGARVFFDRRRRELV